jgi:hypothetical protein
LVEVRLAQSEKPGAICRPDQKWGRFTLMPIGGASLLLATGVEIPPPDDLNQNDFKLVITTKSCVIEVFIRAFLRRGHCGVGGLEPSEAYGRMPLQCRR